TDPNTIFAGTYEGLLKSENQGITWKLVTGSDGRSVSAPSAVAKRQGLRGRDPRQAGVKLPETKIFEIQYSPAAPGTLYVTTPRGSFRSTDNGVIWKELSGPVRDAAVDKIALHIVDSQWILAQTQSQLFISRDQGQTWLKTELGESDLKVY